MGLSTIPAVSGLTRNVVAFTSSQTWTVPSTAQYVDVLVVGGGSGGRGGYRVNNNGAYAGGGGGVTIARNIYLGGTGTVAIVVGAGSSGTSGNALTSQATNPSPAGYSGFGTIVYSGGGNQAFGGVPGSKDSTQNQFTISSQAAMENYNGLAYSIGTESMGGPQTTRNTLGLGIDVLGLTGGFSGQYSYGSTVGNFCGQVPGATEPYNTNSLYLCTIRTPNWFNVNSYLGAATAGTVAGSGGTAGPAGLPGVGGSGGTTYYGTGQNGQGGPGAGGGGGNGGAQLGGSGNGGNGGNAGTNTGGGGGGGGNTGSASQGTGGNGGNGGSGIVLVSWLG